ncbi:hypothetical protein Tco_1500017 [Tanacetum coccineum]
MADFLGLMGGKGGGVGGSGVGRIPTGSRKTLYTLMNQLIVSYLKEVTFKDGRWSAEKIIMSGSILSIGDRFTEAWNPFILGICALRMHLLYHQSLCLHHEVFQTSLIDFSVCVGVGWCRGDGDEGGGGVAAVGGVGGSEVVVPWWGWRLFGGGDVVGGLVVMIVEMWR